MYNNTQGKVINKDLQILDYYETTYNFEVEDNHNYYVSDECVLVHNQCSGIDENQISTGNGKNNVITKNYDEAIERAKNIGGIIGEPDKIVANKYGGFDYTYKRRTRKGYIDVVIKEHMTGHPNRGISKHINVNNGLDNKKWHVFF